LRWYIKIQDKSLISYWCAKPLNKTTVYRHYNKTNKYGTGTKAKLLDLGLSQ